MKLILPLLFFLLNVNVSFSQKTYYIDASKQLTNVQSKHLKMGNPGPEDKQITVNNRYLSLNGVPIIPVMGEMHFSRIPKTQWEDVILKMKACGINIIACYVLWIHHEEIEGQYDWSGNKNLREFTKLCAKHNMWVYPRIGPWCHAEVRNGGTPDWILKKKNIKDRSNDPLYQSYVDSWFKQIGLQLKGLIYKDGGPVIGTQLENEYRLGKAGEEHILWLKSTAKKYSIDVPMYTVTGWQNGSVPPYEVIPLWGGYPDAPWANNLNKSTDCSEYHFSKIRNNESIGNELKKKQEQYIDYEAYPYFTCEVGVGIQNTEHRRLNIGSKDGLGIIISKIASGSNLPGYYMFSGGTNPRGILTSLEENKDETGYWNSYPAISYDFQAAIKESGELNKSYYEIKKLHYFLNEFGSELAPMETFFPTTQEGMQYSVRAKNDSGFLFGLNYCRNNITSEKKDVQFTIKLKNETLTFPSKPINISDKSSFICPINFSIQNVLLKYATAQPLCNIGNKWIFVQDINILPEFAFNASNIEKIDAAKGDVILKNGMYIVSNLKSGIDCIISIQLKDSTEQKIILLSQSEALQAWLFKNDNKKHFFVSEADMYLNGSELSLFSTTAKARVSMLNEKINATKIFATNEYEFTSLPLNISIKEKKPLDDVKWLEIGNSKKADTPNELMHRFITKEFNLDNPSNIKKASLIISTESLARIQINNIWVNQSIPANEMTSLDLTGYVKKGDNKILLDFAYEQKNKAFAAKLTVEYFNTDKVTFTTDQSWLSKEEYIYPSILLIDNGYSTPTIVPEVCDLNKKIENYSNYELEMPSTYRTTYNNVFLNINYTGNKAKLFYNHLLIADDFNNGNTWNIGLNKIESNLENQKLELEISGLKENEPIYFDNIDAKNAAKNAAVSKINLVTEYRINLKLEEMENNTHLLVKSN